MNNIRSYLSYMFLTTDGKPLSLNNQTSIVKLNTLVKEKREKEIALNKAREEDLIAKGKEIQEYLQLNYVSIDTISTGYRIRTHCEYPCSLYQLNMYLDCPYSMKLKTLDGKILEHTVYISDIEKIDKTISDHHLTTDFIFTVRVKGDYFKKIAESEKSK